MSDSKFDVIFRGDVVIGHNIVEVKQRLAQLFKIDTAKVDSLFTGRAMPLKRNLDADSANKYQTILLKAGAQVELRPAGDINVVKKPAPEKRPAAHSQQNNIPTPDQSAAQPSSERLAKKLTLKERLALQEQQDQQHDQYRNTSKSTEAEQSPPASEAADVQSNEQQGFNLAPVGSDLIDAGEIEKPAPVNVDISGISVRPMSGDLLDAEEKPKPKVAAVNVVDYGIAETGADLLKPEEKKQEEPVSINIGDYEVAQVGADMLDAADKIPVPELEIDTSIFDLAPAGSDLGQKKNDPPPPPPDTSAIKLAD